MWRKMIIVGKRNCSGGTCHEKENVIVTGLTTRDYSSRCSVQHPQNSVKLTPGPTLWLTYPERDYEILFIWPFRDTWSQP